MKGGYMVAFTLLHAGPTGHLHPSDLIALGALAVVFAASIVWQRRRG